MGNTSTISSKGQVTVPVEVRRRLGLAEGDRVEFAFEEGTVVLRPLRTGENPFLKWIGVLAPEGGQPDGTAAAWVREMQDDNEAE